MLAKELIILLTILGDLENVSLPLFILYYLRQEKITDDSYRMTNLALPYNSGKNYFKLVNFISNHHWLRKFNQTEMPTQRGIWRRSRILEPFCLMYAETSPIIMRPQNYEELS